MGHIKSESFDTDEGIYLYTKEKPRNPHGKRTRLGGKFRSHKHAEEVSKRHRRPLKMEQKKSIRNL